MGRIVLLSKYGPSGNSDLRVRMAATSRYSLSALLIRPQESGRKSETAMIYNQTRRDGRSNLDRAAMYARLRDK